MRPARIPTVIVVYDNNNKLRDLEREFNTFVRVYTRDSLMGEQLYGIREGILYFDDEGTRQLCLQDDYSGAIEKVKQKVETSNDRAKSLLEEHLKDKGVLSKEKEDDK